MPNFSEGQNQEVIDSISSAIRLVDGVKLLEVDPGYSANRTVMTFVGEPELVLEAAFQAIKTAASLIDMRKHKGVHPRMGATDVCPLIPVEGISMEEVIAWSKELGQRVGDELDIPVYLYEHSASAPYRKNLAAIRKGEYEGFREKISSDKWKPDYGPTNFQARPGQTVIGARDFLIAYNINLDKKDKEVAHEIACDIRESGRFVWENGQKVKGEDGKWKRLAGRCKGLKAIGWIIEEYDRAQVSMNIVDRKLAPLYKVWKACEEAASTYGVGLTGSELVGLIPLAVLLEAAGSIMIEKGIDKLSEKEKVQLVVKYLCLDELTPFQPEQKILEWVMANS